MIIIKIAILVEKYNVYYWFQLELYLITQIISKKYVQKNLLAHDLSQYPKPDLKIYHIIFLGLS